MNRILKYQIDPETRLAMVPVGKVLRVDEVNDAFYQGHFVWIIVNTERLDLHEMLFPKISDTAAPNPSQYGSMQRIQLRVKEKQTISLPVTVPGTPLWACEEDGIIWLHYKSDNTGDLQTVRIVVYKTGQVIDIPPEQLTYIGICKLWILQELALYCFVHHERL